MTLSGDLTADRTLLFGDEDQAHAPFADLLHELVRPDDCARWLELLGAGCLPGGTGALDRLLEELAKVVVGQQQCVDPHPQFRFALTRPVQVGAVALPRTPARAPRRRSI